MGSLLTAAVMIFTVAGSVIFGITLAYTSVLALLHAFASRSRAPKPTFVFVPSQGQVSGD